jgi:hypothetical protein
MLAQSQVKFPSYLQRFLPQQLDQQQQQQFEQGQQEQGQQFEQPRQVEDSVKADDPCQQLDQHQQHQHQHQHQHGLHHHQQWQGEDGPFGRLGGSGQGVAPPSRPCGFLGGWRDEEQVEMVSGTQQEDEGEGEDVRVVEAGAEEEGEGAVAQVAGGQQHGAVHGQVHGQVHGERQEAAHAGVSLLDELLREQQQLEQRRELQQVRTNASCGGGGCGVRLRGQSSDQVQELAPASH